MQGGSRGTQDIDTRSRATPKVRGGTVARTEGQRAVWRARFPGAESFGGRRPSVSREPRVGKGGE